MSSISFVANIKYDLSSKAAHLGRFFVIELIRRKHQKFDISPRSHKIVVRLLCERRVRWQILYLRYGFKLWRSGAFFALRRRYLLFPLRRKTTSVRRRIRRPKRKFPRLQRRLCAKWRTKRRQMPSNKQLPRRLPKALKRSIRQAPLRRTHRASDSSIATSSPLPISSDSKTSMAGFSKPLGPSSTKSIGGNNRS